MKDPLPHLHTKGSYVEKRNYVMSRLVEEAENKTLCLTDFMNQPPHVRAMVGDCILGWKISRESRMPAKVPEALRRYTVKIRAIPHLEQKDKEMADGSTHTTWKEEITPIRFRFGSEEVDESMEYLAARTAGYKRHSSTEPVKAVWIDTGETEVDLPIDQAWWCLRDQGRNVKRASSRRTQRLYWKVEEVPPGEEPKRKPGRPRKGEVASATA